MANRKVSFHNKISSNYRELHVDGAFGGVTTRGYINLSFYAERAPIPKSTDFELTEDNTVGNLIGHSEDSKTGILREFEFGIYMDLNAARTLAEFINNKVADLEKLLKDNNDKNTSR
jgi:hypothetical protein